MGRYVSCVFNQCCVFFLLMVIIFFCMLIMCVIENVTHVCRLLSTKRQYFYTFPHKHVITHLAK